MSCSSFLLDGFGFGWLLSLGSIVETILRIKEDLFVKFNKFGFDIMNLDRNCIEVYVKQVGKVMVVMIKGIVDCGNSIVKIK